VHGGNHHRHRHEAKDSSKPESSAQALAQRQAIVGQLALLNDCHHRRADENNAGSDQLVEYRDRLWGAAAAYEVNDHSDSQPHGKHHGQEDHQPPTGAQLGGVEEDATHGAPGRLLDGTEGSVGRQNGLAIQSLDALNSEYHTFSREYSQPWRSSYPEFRVELSERRSIRGSTVMDSAEVAMREVIPQFLWVGNAWEARDVSNLLDLGIVAVVDLAIEEAPIVFPRDVVYCRFPLVDGSGNSHALLNAAVETTTILIGGNVPTLVACSGGMSRSPAVVAVALARAERTDPHKTLLRVAGTGPHDVSPVFWAELTEACAS
jgi:hypothetical protein